MAEYTRYQEIFLWEKEAPLSTAAETKSSGHFMPGNDGIERLTDVDRPSITFYPVSGKGPHPAVLVAPGGGYQFLAWNHEGCDIAGFFNAIGFSAFVLKYRVPDCRKMAHADAVRALRLIRAEAAEFNVDPARLGMLGFSAGAHLTATAAASVDAQPYAPQDEIDRFCGKPDFTALIYPAYLTENPLALKDEFKIDNSTPPAFLLQAENDPIQVENALAYFYAMKQAGRPAELHCYADGGHGYGLLRTGNAVSGWGNLAARWFREMAHLQ